MPSMATYLSVAAASRATGAKSLSNDQYILQVKPETPAEELAQKQQVCRLLIFAATNPQNDTEGRLGSAEEAAKLLRDNRVKTWLSVNLRHDQWFRNNAETDSLPNGSLKRFLEEIVG